MKCLKIDQIYNYLEGEISRAEKVRIKGHLSKCKKCSQLYKERKILLESFREIPRFSPPPYFTEQIMLRIKNAEVSWRQVLISFLGITSLLFFSIISYLMIKGKSLYSIFSSIGHFGINLIKNSSIIFAKILKLFIFIFDLTKSLLIHFVNIIYSIISSGVELEITIIISLIILFSLSVISYLYLKKVLVKM